MERFLKISRGDGGARVQCRLCGRLFLEMGSHLERVHGVASSDYGFDVPRTKRERPSGLTYVRRVAYRMPDGSYVRRRDAWEKAWAPEEPPEDSVVDAESVCLDKWYGKEKGVDFVECSICGHRCQNLVRHVRSKHGIEPDEYDGRLKSEKCEKMLSEAAMKTWDSRGRMKSQDRTKNKTHKVNGLDEGRLRRLYEEEGLSDAKIGKMYGMTGAGVGYRRRKWGIPTKSR